MVQETDPPLWWLLDMEVMPVAGYILDQVAGALLKGPVGRQIRVIVLNSAHGHVSFVCLCALQIACYTLQTAHAKTLNPADNPCCSSQLQASMVHHAATHQLPVCCNSREAGGQAACKDDACCKYNTVGVVQLTGSWSLALHRQQVCCSSQTAGKLQL